MAVIQPYLRARSGWGRSSTCLPMTWELSKDWDPGRPFRSPISTEPDTQGPFTDAGRTELSSSPGRKKLRWLFLSHWQGRFTFSAGPPTHPSVLTHRAPDTEAWSQCSVGRGRDGGLSSQCSVSQWRVQPCLCHLGKLPCPSVPQFPSAENRGNGGVLDFWELTLWLRDSLLSSQAPNHSLSSWELTSFARNSKEQSDGLLPERTKWGLRSKIFLSLQIHISYFRRGMESKAVGFWGLFISRQQKDDGVDDGSIFRQ